MADGALPFIDAPVMGRCKWFLAGESGPDGLTCAAQIPIGASWCVEHRAIVAAPLSGRREQVYPVRR